MLIVSMFRMFRMFGVIAMGVMVAMIGCSGRCVRLHRRVHLRFGHRTPQR